MDVIIRVVETGEVLDIFPKFALENKITSAFFSTEGSRSISVSLPITDRNTRIFGQADRLDRKHKTNKKIPVIINKGSYSRKGTLYFNGSQNSEYTYTASIAYDEAVFYELQSKLKLTQLPNLPVIMEPTDKLIQYCNSLLTEDNVEEPLTIFQIYLKLIGTYDQTLTMADGKEWVVKVEQPFPLNEWKKDYYNDIVELIVKDKVTMLKDGKPLDIKATRGMGISPFVRGWYIIDKIAEHFGYEVGDNPFRTEPQLRRLTFLNNTADAIVADYLDYKQLMPDVTITDFFQFLWARFGAKVFIDGNTNTLHIRLLKDSINQKDAKLLPISGKYAYDEATPKQIKLTAGKSLDMSATETDTYEEFCKKYNNVIGSFAYDYSEQGLGGILYDSRRGLFFHAVLQPKVGDEGKRDEAIKTISSIHFDWDKKSEGLEYVEITSPDECITAHWEDEEGMYPYYGIDFALMNSVMEIDREVQDRNELNKLAACWDMGQYYYGDGVNDRREQGYKFGSIFPYMPEFSPARRKYYVDREGNTFKYALTWVEKDGCFEHFWKKYDAMLRHSNHQVKGKLDLPPFDLASLNISDKYIVGNHPILLTEFNYITGNINVERQEFTGVTVGLYEPNNLKEEQAHPAPEPIKYKWGLQSEKQEKLDKHEAQIIKSYKDKETDRYKFRSFKWTDIKDPNPPSMEGLWYLPPTEKDFKEQILRGKTTHHLEASYKVEYSRFIESTETGEGTGSYWKDEEYIGLEKIEYNSYFLPVLRDGK